MDRDASYVAVGGFVLLVVAMASAFVFWYAGHGDKHGYARYEIYFRGSVSGLTNGSPVRYLGVDVGKVVRITLDPSRPKRVRVVADIDTHAPIDSRTRASLSLQGVTGLLFIDLEQDARAGAPHPLPQGLHHPLILSAPSDFDVLLSSLPALTTRAVELVDRLNQVFSDHNVAALGATIDNARRASERLPAVIHDVQQLVDEVRVSSQQVDGAAVELRAIATDSAPQIRRTMGHVAAVAGNLADTTRRLDHLVADNGAALTRFSRHSLPQLDQLLRESRATARSLRELSRSLQEDPSRLLYRPRASGVAVPR
ncbi:MAG TPA: MlaD family protein [Steroidobacteraceae bacterium]|nr:MlaD family protein [Steroidobacteraceae bacterium]